MKMLVTGLAALAVAIAAAPASAQFAAAGGGAGSGGGGFGGGASRLLNGPDFTAPRRGDRPDRPRRRGWYGYGIGWGHNDYDGGYFRSDGERPSVANGSVRYDYDRGYPYDHYSYALEPEARRDSRRLPSCETEWTRGSRGGDLVPVRVCRN